MHEERVHKESNCNVQSFLCDDFFINLVFNNPTLTRENKPPRSATKHDMHSVGGEQFVPLQMNAKTAEWRQHVLVQQTAASSDNKLRPSLCKQRRSISFQSRLHTAAEND